MHSFLGNRMETPISASQYRVFGTQGYNSWIANRLSIHRKFNAITANRYICSSVQIRTAYESCFSTGACHHDLLLVSALSSLTLPSRGGYIPSRYSITRSAVDVFTSFGIP